MNILSIYKKLTLRRFTIYIKDHFYKELKILGVLYTIKSRIRIKNKNFSILCPTCIGGFIYHRLGLKFLSPTINLWIDQRDFIKLVKNLPHYMNEELKFISSEFSYPVAQLDDIKIMFNHYKSEDDARYNWEKRKERINYDNLYIIFYDKNHLTKDEILNLRTVKCKRMVVLSPERYNDIEYVKTMKINHPYRQNSQTYLDEDIAGIKSFEKQFDYVAWLNGSQKY